MTSEIVHGRYRLERRVGISQMAEVWAAHDLELDRPVTVKLLGRDADRRRFEREARAIAALSHPNIRQLYDYGETGERQYMVLERVDEGTLEERLTAGKPLPDDETERLAGELAAALAYAHAQGVVHRDVKPSNVLFDAEGTAKLADFGIARIVEASTLTEAGTALGTAHYLSPEQSRGEPAKPATDVYAFGIVLYRLLTGRLPYEADSPLEVAAMHSSTEPEPITSVRPDAPGELSRLAMWSIAKRPGDRPADGAALVAELSGPEPAAAEEETQAMAVPRRRFGRRPIVAGAGLASLALAGIGLAALLTPEPSPAPVIPSESWKARTASTTATQPASPASTRPTTRRQTTPATPAKTSTFGNTTRTASTATTNAATTTAAAGTTDTTVTTTTATTTTTDATTTTG